jgi:hypothetical protein
MSTGHLGAADPLVDRGAFTSCNNPRHWYVVGCHRSICWWLFSYIRKHMLCDGMSTNSDDTGKSDRVQHFHSLIKGRTDYYVG